MGCWNAVCAISKMRIRYNDRVKAILLASVEHSVGTLRSNAFSNPYKIFGLPISATYNDYGSIENVDDNDANNLMLEILSKGKYNTDTYEDVFAAIERGDYTIDTYYITNEITLTLRMAFVREEVWDDYVSKYYDGCFEDCFAFRYMDSAEEEIQREVDIYDGLDTVIMKAWLKSFNEMKNYKLIVHKDSHLSSRQGGLLYTFLRKIKYDVISDEIVKLSHELRIIDCYLDAVLLSQWIPDAGVHQTFEYDLVIDYHADMIERCIEASRWTDEECPNTLVVCQSEIERALKLIENINKHDLSKIIMDHEYFEDDEELKDFKYTGLSNLDFIKEKIGQLSHTLDTSNSSDA